VDFAGSVRAAAKMPVMEVGRFHTTAAMIESLGRGELDLIGSAVRSLQILKSRARIRIVSKYQ
jgi:2,4-dienoyl-CoA reductase-like NADH-dependent reductase (Old Yellow Enzyme family)